LSAAGSAGNGRVDDLIASALQSGIEASRLLIRHRLSDIRAAARILVESLDAGGKLLVAGNGGSAADAQHFATELAVRYAQDRRALPAIALTTDTSILTAAGNDLGFSEIFARQVEALGASGDVLVAISTSGNSPNILRAVETAVERGLHTVGLTGASGGQLAGRVNAVVRVPSAVTARIQECHLAIEHIWCQVIELCLLDMEPNDPAPVGAVGGDPATMTASKVVGLDALLVERKAWAAAGLTVSWTNGCFDLLHPGHLASLEAAAATGDVLVVGVNSDGSLTRRKRRAPAMADSDRTRVVAALACVDRVVVFDDVDPSAVLDRLRPDIHCKGAEYANASAEEMPEAAVVLSYGGRVEFIEMLEGYSSTWLRDRASGAGRH